MSQMKRISVQLDPETWSAVQGHARRHKLSYSLVVVQAVKESMFPEHREQHDADLMAGLDRIEYQIKELRTHSRDEAATMKEMLGTFVRIWLNTVAQVPKEHRAAAARSGAERFDRYLDLIVQNLERGDSVLDRQPKPQDDDDLNLTDTDDETD